MRNAAPASTEAASINDQLGVDAQGSFSLPSSIRLFNGNVASPKPGPHNSGDWNEETDQIGGNRSERCDVRLGERCSCMYH